MAIAIKNEIIKKIIVILLSISMICSFVMPNYIYAMNVTEEDAQSSADEYSNQASTILDEIKTLLGIEDSINDESSAGGTLFTPISDFLVGIADSVMGTLQSVFLEDNKILSNILAADSIKLEGPANHRKVNFYIIKYSPAAIFSGNVPALDVNFFEPEGSEDGKVNITKSSINYNETGTFTYQQCKDSFGAPDSVNIYYDKISTTEIVLRVISLICVIDAIEAIGNLSVGFGIGLEIEAELTIGSLISAATFGVLASVTNVIANTLMFTRQTVYWRMWQDNATNTWYFWIATRNLVLDQVENLFTDVENKSGSLYQISENIETYTKDSTAYKLRTTISTWYGAFRTFALVALLSVLVYIGIRIILSSASAQDKAKYKNMLVDWLTALCILFVLHYLMAFILNITAKLTEIFKVNTVSEGGIDYLMTTIRNSIVQRNGSIFNYWGYVIMYITLVILTISFTFEYIKRLIFLVLLTMIAPLIALTYPLDKIKDNQAQGFSLWLREYVFNCLLQPLHLLLYAMLVTTAIKTINNPIIAIVALALFKPAENFLRKLFGFDKASTMNSLGTIAGGAMVMNMLNKLPKGSKHSNSNNNPGNSGDKNSIRMNEQNINSSGNANKQNNNSSGNGHSKSNKTQTHSSKNGFKALGKKALKSSPNVLAKGMRWTTKTAMKTGGALAGTMVGIASGAADGQIGIPAKNIAAGIYAGSKAGEAIVGNTEATSKKLINGMGTKIDDIIETYQKGKMGEEDYNKEQARRAFYSSNAWQNIENDSSIQGDKNAKVEEFLNNGITNPEEIEKAISNNVTSNDYVDYRKSGIGNVEDMAKLQASNIKANDYEKFKEYGEQDINRISRVRRKHNSLSTDKVARNMSIAKHGIGLEREPFMKFAMSADPTMTEDEAKHLADELGSYIL